MTTGSSSERETRQKLREKSSAERAKYEPYVTEVRTRKVRLLNLLESREVITWSFEPDIERKDALKKKCRLWWL